MRIPIFQFRPDTPSGKGVLELSVSDLEHQRRREHESVGLNRRAYGPNLPQYAVPVVLSVPCALCRMGLCTLRERGTAVDFLDC